MSALLAGRFRENVRSRMDELGITQSELSTKLRVSESYVSQLLSGHRQPGLDGLEKIAKALKTDPSWLISENLAKAS